MKRNVNTKLLVIICAALMIGLIVANIIYTNIG